MIDIIDYKAGNAPSVSYALEKLGISCRLITTAEEIESSTKIIFPGVGSAKATLDSLRQMGCLENLHKKVIEERVPFLGICIGFQILFEYSEEDDTECFGWIKGKVKQFSKQLNPVPQIGWNEVKFTREHPLLEGVGQSNYFYFVNSYYAVPKENSVIFGLTDYGVNFCSVLLKDNIFATQFHVEKSGPIGLRILENFAHEKSNLC
ncbi:imidazole glycerol phosphate synthase subunit HisH [Plectonema radiosum NIES-515]|uniref:Imidazole glycerol phosphate synthase subunit HisH n=1 Tax=Plectonema radiosum NIES-515 TaxID=2986073 RepID=A0ABT3AXE2_9CYAN|nr:imidazole glycerol phosphate synthase subunit HisH [Plectonema radiosum]MCV3213796.1 imidazole glycerol phosphate synthase subunit HisH [Plectonema radiosum NIES-515]